MSAKIIKFSITLILVIFLAISGFISNAHAGDLGTIGEGLDDIFPYHSTDAQTAGINMASILSNLLGFLTVIAGLFFTIRLILGAYQWLAAGGDKTALQNAQKIITNAIIGLIIIVAAYTIARLIGYLTGLNIFNISKQINKLSPK